MKIGSTRTSSGATVPGARLLPSLLLATLLAACGGGDGPTEAPPQDPPSITGFTATPTQIALGGSSTLAWTTTGATTCSINGGVGPVPCAGSVEVTPDAPITYTLSAAGPGGSRTASASVALFPPTLTALTPDEGLPGETVALTLTGTGFATGTTQVTVLGAGITVADLVVVNGTTLTISAIVAPDAAPGDRTFRVQTPAGTSGTLPFTVLVGVSPAGGTITGPQGSVVLEVPAGAVPAPSPLSIEANPAPPADPNLVPGTAWNLGPDGATFAQPVTVRIRFDPGQLPNGANPADLVVHRWDGAAWQPLANGAVDVGASMASGTTTAFSPFGILHLTDDPGEPPAGAAFRAIGNGGSHACGVLVDGTAYCWGENDDGQLGRGTLQAALSPVAVVGGQLFTEISPGYDHTCALTEAGQAFCWGAGAHGQIGDGVFGGRTAPAAVTGGHTFVQVAAGYDHACALDVDGAAWCWGRGWSGVLGNDATQDEAQPVPVAGGHVFQSITAGGYHTCGLTSTGQAWCWGWGDDGQLGTGDRADHEAPVLVAGNHTFATLSAGGYHTCGIDDQGATLCWGWSTGGQAGAFQSRVLLPTPIPGGPTFQTLAAGGAHTCAMTAAGVPWCWGTAASGSLGTGIGQADANEPQPVAGGHLFHVMSGGDWHACGITEDHDAWCWGWWGGVGNGTGMDSWSPSQVTIPNGPVSAPGVSAQRAPDARTLRDRPRGR